MSVPVFFMEPVSTLQKLAEILEYNELLDMAAMQTDPAQRIAWVAAFAVSLYPATERCYKPFNPILGETFEWHDLSRDVHLMSEQVSHHPPIGAAFASAKDWTYQIVSAPKTKFLGNSLEVYPVNRTRITMKDNDEQFWFKSPTTTAHNIIVGFSWIDTSGTFEIGSTKSGHKVVLEFTACGWLGAGRYEFSGYVIDAEGTKKVKIQGKWNSHFEMAPCDAAGEPTGPFAKVWSCRKKPEHPYGFTNFAVSLNSAEGYVPRPGDSRRRPDRHYLEHGESGQAQGAKTFLEEMQRAERKVREERGEKWEPKFFRKVDDGFDVLGSEPQADEFPFYEWRGVEGALVPTLGEEKCGGAKFSPWCYPDAHSPLYFEDK